ncbi:MAG: dephospho-CoA kinase [Alphaproteobacteria bacterium]|nr:dephospho-CoA kinase [Alphaproteobacteria bacterium]
MAKKMFVIGLTGSIGMGKSTACKMFRECGYASLSSDQIVHDLCGEKGKATPKIAKLFPLAVGKHGVDRQKLGELVLADEEKFDKLEKILHPFVFAACKDFVRQEKKKKSKGVVLEIPLLFETGFNTKCDVTVCVSATADLQKERVMKRRGMTPKKMKVLLKRQMPDREKRARADFIIRSDKGLQEMHRQIVELCKSLS